MDGDEDGRVAPHLRCIEVAEQRDSVMLRIGDAGPDLDVGSLGRCGAAHRSTGAMGAAAKGGAAIAGMVISVVGWFERNALVEP
jgi:hypothetical protein